MIRALNPSPLRVRRASPRRRATRSSRPCAPWRGAPALGVDEEPAATGARGELDAFLKALPARMRCGLARHPEVQEVVMDLGRRPVARFPSGDWVISHQPVTADDLRQAVSKVMIEAVENHMPEVVVVDEIGTKLEAMAASTIAQRGVQLVGTAHGVTIKSIIQNPCLQMLVGGIASVTLGDEEAKKHKVKKTILERKGSPTFSCAVEMISRTECRVHRKLETTVDAILAGKPPKFEARNMNTKPIESEGPLVISGQKYERDKVYTRTNKGLSSGGSKGKSTQSPKPLSASGPTFSKKKKSRSRAGLRAMVAQVGSTTGTPETIEGLRRSPRLKHLLEMVTKAWLHLLQAQPGAPPLRSRPPFLPTKR